MSQKVILCKNVAFSHHNKHGLTRDETVSEYDLFSNKVEKNMTAKFFLHSLNISEDRHNMLFRSRRLCNTFDQSNNRG